MSKTKGKQNKVSLTDFLNKGEKKDGGKTDAWGDHEEGPEETGVTDYGYEMSSDEEKPKKHHEKPSTERRTERRDEPRERREQREVPEQKPIDESRIPTDGPFVA